MNIGTITIEIMPTDDPATRRVKVSVADERCAWTKRFAVQVSSAPTADEIVIEASAFLTYRYTDFLRDPARHADPIGSSREAESSCPVGPQGGRADA